LAVGDAAFQKKCLGKMGEVAREGRTVLFVSHNMGAIRQLCQKGILLRNGFLEQYGNVSNVIDSYLHDNIDVSNNVTFKDDNLNYPIFIKSAAILNERNEPSMFFQMGEGMKFRVTLQRRDKVVPEVLAINIKTSEGELISNIHSQDANFTFGSSVEDETIDVVINEISYYPDKYYVTLVLKTPDQRFIKKHDCLMFEVTQNRKLTERRLITAHGRYFVKSSWSHFQEEEP
ncbi:MAG: Wzt carbohydrate-binding domain-containing protein, partial [candidate division WOR-3 bacterium]|nr:Wzt carbohydrate-binding domain-containing protein [candidate division WOR-3 bacterium]